MIVITFDEICWALIISILISHLLCNVFGYKIFNFSSKDIFYHFFNMISLEIITLTVIYNTMRNTLILLL